LHVGDVMYGNIGGDARLDFTVIGPAVNLTARIESMGKTLQRSPLLSVEFVQARACGRNSWANSRSAERARRALPSPLPLAPEAYDFRVIARDAQGKLRLVTGAGAFDDFEEATAFAVTLMDCW
jgi:hypothetical protein